MLERLNALIVFTLHFPALIIQERQSARKAYFLHFSFCASCVTIIIPALFCEVASGDGLDSH